MNPDRVALHEKIAFEKWEGYAKPIERGRHVNFGDNYIMARKAAPRTDAPRIPSSDKMSGAFTTSNTEGRKTPQMPVPLRMSGNHSHQLASHSSSAGCPLVPAGTG